MIPDKLSEIEKRYGWLSEKLSQPDAASDPDKFGALMREYRQLTPVIEKYREILTCENRLSDAEALTTSSDPELRALAEEEKNLNRSRIAALTDELTVLLLPHDPNDDKNVVMEIRAGAGGEEAALFAAELFRMYGMFAEASGYRIERVSAHETELGGFREIVFLVTGAGAYSRLKYEMGVHRVQRVPDTESQGRIHTSTVTVAVLPEAEEIEVEISPDDLKIESMKSSGAGGQHINKTESAIRLYHKPTGIVIECQEERSQFKNRDKAMRLLRAKLFDLKKRERDDKLASERRSQIGTGDRSEKIRTYNFPQSRVTDHRIGYTTHNLESFLNGDMGGLLDALAAADTAEQLRKSQI